MDSRRLKWVAVGEKVGMTESDGGMSGSEDDVALGVRLEWGHTKAVNARFREMKKEVGSLPGGSDSSDVLVVETVELSNESRAASPVSVVMKEPVGVEGVVGSQGTERSEEMCDGSVSMARDERGQGSVDVVDEPDPRRNPDVGLQGLGAGLNEIKILLGEPKNLTKAETVSQADEGALIH